MQNLLAANPFGTVSPPPGINKYKGLTEGGLVSFLNVILNLLVVVAALYALFNLIFAGYQFISAGGDQKAVEAAWGKIWQTLLGLLIVAGAFVLAALFGWLIFGDPTAILRPTIFVPGEPLQYCPDPLGRC